MTTSRTPLRIAALLVGAVLAACASPAADSATDAADSGPIQFVEVRQPDASTAGYVPPAGEGPMAYIIAPGDGATVDTTFRIVMGVRGVGIAPAGVERDGTGHLHVLIDVDAPATGEVIPADSLHRHFGGGQTETMLTLAPGEHTLRLVLGDAAHRVIGPELVSAPVRVTVRAP